MRKVFFVFIAILATSYLGTSYPGQLISEKRTQYMPEIPTISFATMSSSHLQIKALKKFRRFEITIPKKDIINLAITRNKNPILSELIPGNYLSKFILTLSNNNFEDTPVDAQVIINGQVQSIKIVGFNFTPKTIKLIVKPFIHNRTIKLSHGPGVVVISSPCITNRVVCVLGCTYMIVPDKECRKKLGIL
jgi:hypothetical protein